MKKKTFMLLFFIAQSQMQYNLKGIQGFVFFFNFWHNLIKESADSHYTINKDSERNF